VTASGPWTITVDPVSAAPAWDGAAMLAGKGDAVYRVDPPSSGLTTVRLTYLGEGHFAVWAYPGSDLLANDAGPFQGRELLPDGTVLLSITASAPWSIEPS
jgi:hypothetical protein